MQSDHDERIEHEMHRLDASNDPFAAAVRATRMPMLITDPRRPDNPIIFANDAFAKLTGYHRAEILGHNCRFLQGPATNPADVAQVRVAMAKRVSIEIDLLNYKKDGSSFWNRLMISPVFNESGELSYFFASQFDVSPDRNRLGELEASQSELESEIEKRMLELVQNENRLRFILHSARMGTWTLDLASQRLFASVHCKENYGRGPAEPFTYGDLAAAIHPDDFDRWQTAVDEAIAGAGEFDIEYRIISPVGERRWIHVLGQVTRDAHDDAVGMVGISQDITARKEADEHRKLLARELSHRVKNSLATSQAIFAQSLRTAKSLDEARDNVLGRMRALSAAQDILTSKGLGGADLDRVVREVLKPLAGGQMRASGPRVLLGAKAVSSFSLALHELATNAAKYGALSKEGGGVTINWTIDQDQRLLQFKWIESGGPPVKHPTRTGFGTQMIKKVLAVELNGKAEIDYRVDGMHLTLSIPLGALIETGAPTGAVE